MSIKTTLKIISWGFILLALACAAFGIKYSITKDYNAIILTHKILNLIFEFIFIVLYFVFKALAEMVDQYGPFKDRN